MSRINLANGSGNRLHFAQGYQKVEGLAQLSSIRSRMVKAPIVQIGRDGRLFGNPDFHMF
jgi:hypothetical protein